MPISGVLGEWNAAAALWQLLLRAGSIVERHASRETLYRLELDPATPAATADPRVIAQLPGLGVETATDLAQRRGVCPALLEVLA